MPLQFKNVQRFLRGLFEKEDAETAIADDVFVKLHNVDVIAPEGFIRRRRGYSYWSDIQNGASVPIGGVPDVTGKVGFGSKVQSIRGWADVSNKRRTLVVSNGKIYAQEFGNDGKTWDLFNPNKTLKNKSTKVDIASYYDNIFFNDKGENVYCYNAFNFTEDRWTTSGPRSAYFAGDRIYLRDTVDFSALWHTALNILAVDQTYRRFTVAGDQRTYFADHDQVLVSGSTGNDGYYHITSVEYTTETVITVEEAIPDATADGTIKSIYRIKIEDKDSNWEGKAIWDSLVEIGYIGSGSGYPVDISLNQTLELGFCLKVENDFYVLDNQRNRRQTQEMHLIKFNDRFIAQDFITFETDLTLGEYFDVKNFAHHGDYFYVFCKDGTISKINILDMSGSEITTPDVAALEAPRINVWDGDAYYSDTRVYSINASADGIFVYSRSCADATNLYQPLIFDRKLSITPDIWDMSSPNYISGIYDKNFRGDVAIDYSWFWPSNTDPSIWPQYAKNIYTLTKDFCKPFKSNVLQYFYFRTISRASYYCESAFGCYDIADAYGAYLFNRLDVSNTQFENKILFLSFKLAFTNNDLGDQNAWWIAESRKGITSPAFTSQNYYHTFPFFNWSYYLFNDNIVVPEILYRFDRFDSRVPGYLHYQLGVTFKNSRVFIADEGAYHDCPNDFSAFLAMKSPYFLFSNVAPAALGKQIYDYSASGLTRRNDIFWAFNDGSTSYYDASLTVAGGKITSTHLLVIGLDLNGNALLYSHETLDEGAKSIRFIVPLMLLSDIAAIHPIEHDINEDELSFGLSGEATGGIYYGQNYKVKISTFELETQSQNISSYRTNIPDDGDERWLCGGPWVDAQNLDQQMFRISESWDYTMGGNVHQNFSNLLRYNSNFFRFMFMQITGDVADTDQDKIQELGTPKPLTVFFEPEAAPSLGGLLKGTKLLYQCAFVFYSGRSTYLSPVSAELVVPDMGVADPQPLKVKITSVNLENVNGQDIYDPSEILYIRLYRKEMAADAMSWTEPLLLCTFEKDSYGRWFYLPAAPPFGEGEYEDQAQDLLYNPFTYVDVLRYRCAHLVFHKSRMILVNNSELVNGNVVQYSDVDMAESIPESNLREIESGDGEYLTAGVSERDYLFLFKPNKIYAILGDVADGQLADVSKINGCKYKNLICQHEGRVYWLNENGIYRLTNLQIEDLSSEGQVHNYFDQRRGDCIDFENLADNGFAAVDVYNNEIKFHVPVKSENVAQTQNNVCVIFNLRTNAFRTYGHADAIFEEVQIQDTEDSSYRTLLADYTGKVFEATQEKNDDGKPITYVIRTKEFNIDSNMLAKAYKILKLFGKNFDVIRLSYWIDGERMEGSVCYRSSFSGADEAFVELWSSGGRANKIMIEISGEAVNDAPFLIEELLVGYEVLGGIK